MNPDDQLRFSYIAEAPVIGALGDTNYFIIDNDYMTNPGQIADSGLLGVLPVWALAFNAQTWSHLYPGLPITGTVADFLPETVYTCPRVSSS